eukprot:2577968-Amphidinium_carterae.1
MRRSFDNAEGVVRSKVDRRSEPTDVHKNSAHELVWVTICTPPRCSAQDPALEHLRRVSPIPVRVLHTIRGKSIHFEVATGRAMDMDEKLEMLFDYLTGDEEGKKWERIILQDASDVIANPGSIADVVKAYEELVGHEDKILISAVPTCWINSFCTAGFLHFLQRRFPEHFAPRPGMDQMQDFYKFVNAGQHMASRKAMLDMLRYASK